MIAISDLHFSYQRKKVFNGLSLSLQPGHIYGLLGKNGTGKSTLLRNIAGLLFPSKGAVSVGGFNPVKRQPSFLQTVFMIAEEFYLPNITIDSFLKANASFYPAFDRSQFNNYLREFEMPTDQKLQQLSYGQKKKMMISFGLACNTSVLLMDEPTNGLDIMSKSQFRRVIAGAINEDRFIIICTHQVKDLESLIDRITVIDDGQILFDQSTDAITARLKFSLSFDPDEIRQAVYKEESLKGTLIITENKDEEESKLDLEMLYKAIVTNGDRLRNTFTSSPYNA